MKLFANYSNLFPFARSNVFYVLNWKSIRDQRNLNLLIPQLGQEHQAREALKRLRNTPHIEDDIDEMRAEELAQQAEAQITMWELLRSPSLRMPLTIAVVMQLSQQLSGINAVFYYSTNLFITTGLSETSAKYATIGIGTVMVLMTLVSIPLMDRSGRRTLHLYGLGGMFIFSIFITISFLVKVSLILVWKILFDSKIE